MRPNSESYQSYPAPLRVQRSRLAPPAIAAIVRPCCFGDRGGASGVAEISFEPPPWYVSLDCIDCDLCREVAPETFQRDDDLGYSVVYRQPQSPADLVRAEEARASCPAEAICNDGP